MFLMKTLQGGQLLLYFFIFILPMLRRNLTLKRILKANFNRLKAT